MAEKKKKEPKNNIGQYIRYIRKTLGIDSCYAGSLCGALCWRSVTEIEGRRRKCSLEDLQWILRWFYNVKGDVLLEVVQGYQENPVVYNLLMEQSLLAKQYCDMRNSMTDAQREIARLQLIAMLDNTVQSGADIFMGANPPRDVSGKFATYGSTGKDIWL